MKRLSVLAVLLVLAVGCGTTTPTTPSGASTVKFTATLLPSNEVPVVTNADASGRGTLDMTLNLTKDAAGTITAATVDFTFALTAFPAGTTLTGAHIHQAAAGTTAGVLISAGLGTGEIVLVNGAQTITKSGIAVAAADAQGLINNPSGYYFNVHTTINTGGAARGQIVKQ